MVSENNICNKRFDVLDARIIGLELRLKESEDRSKERVIATAEKIALALSSADKATNKYESAVDERFKSANEFRAAMQDQATRLLPKEVYDVRTKSISDSLTMLTDRINLLEINITKLQERALSHKEGLSSTSQIAVIIFGLISFIIAIISIFINKHII